jgi:hypothetical protein
MNININYNTLVSDLCLIGRKYDTDKSPQRVNVNINRHAYPYTLFYDSIFKEIKNNKLNILEFGILEGASLLMWREYFSNSKIVGLDNDVNYLNKMRNEGFDVSFVDVKDENSISNTLNTLDMMFDIIIEDTTHKTDDQIRIIKNSVKYLKPGGILIVEHICLHKNEEDYYNKLGDTLNEFQNYYFLTLDHNKKYSQGANNDKLLVLVKKGEEPLIKNKNKITIITPSFRPENLKKIYDSIDFNYIDEWIIVYDGIHIKENINQFNHEKIKEYIYKNEDSMYGNAQRNYALDNIKNENTFLFFLDDDNIIQKDFYKFLDIIDNDKIYTFNQVGNYKYLKGNNIQIYNMDTNMILISYKLCKNIRWHINNSHADFSYINDCYILNKDKHIYIDNDLSHYNCLRK